ncbi:MAG TPA: hypothetical protein PLN85_01585 [archaeon]|nr:hypothetical protein [archaeon]
MNEKIKIDFKNLTYEIEEFNIKQNVIPFIGGVLTADNIEIIANLHYEYLLKYKEYNNAIEALNEKYNNEMNVFIEEIKEWV